jgi:hypothetical protein
MLFCYVLKAGNSMSTRINLAGMPTSMPMGHDPGQGPFTAVGEKMGTDAELQRAGRTLDTLRVQFRYNTLAFRKNNITLSDDDSLK